MREAGRRGTSAPAPEGTLSHLSRSPALDYFRRTVEAFQEALRFSRPRVDRCYRIADHLIRVSFAGECLVPHLEQALSHRAVSSGAPPDLTILVWDSLSTGVRLPAPHWGTDDLLPRGRIRGMDTDLIRSAYHPAGGLSFLDLTRNLGIFWVPTLEAVTIHECSFPFRTILNWWMLPRGRQLLHAGAIGDRQGGLLVTGKSGSGKSTTTLACLLAGLEYLGDDHVLVGWDVDPMVFGIYNSAKLEPEQLAKLPDLKKTLSPMGRRDNEKCLMFLPGAASPQVGGLPLRALLIPRITGSRRTSLSPASPSSALKSLAPSSLFQFPGSDTEAFSNMARLVRCVSAYFLNLGTDLAAIPEAVWPLLSAGELE